MMMKKFTLKIMNQGRKKAAEMLVHNEIKSIHTVETTLQTIFVKLTGKELENESSSY